MTKERMTINLPPGSPIELKFGTRHLMIISNNSVILFFRLHVNISDTFHFYVFRDYLEMAKNEIRPFVIRRQNSGAFILFIHHHEILYWHVKSPY